MIAAGWELAKGQDSADAQGPRPSRRQELRVGGGRHPIRCDSLLGRELGPVCLPEPEGYEALIAAHVNAGIVHRLERKRSSCPDCCPDSLVVYLGIHN